MSDEVSSHHVKREAIGKCARAEPEHKAVRRTKGSTGAAAQPNSEIDERRRIEKELRKQAEERYVRASVAGRVGVWDWDLKTDEIYVDPELKRLLGYEDHEIQNNINDWGSKVHPDDADLVMAEATKHLEGVTARYEVEHRMLHKDGSIRWFLARGTVTKATPIE